MNLYYPDIRYHCNLVLVIEKKFPRSISSAPTISYAITNKTKFLFIFTSADTVICCLNKAFRLLIIFSIICPVI